MHKFWIILTHTYMSRVKTKSFIISTLITLLFIFGIANIQSIIDMFSSEESADTIAVIDETGELIEPLKTSIDQAEEDVKLVPFHESAAKAEKAVQEEEYEAFILLSINKKDEPKADYFANNITDSDAQLAIEQQSQQLKIAMATEQAGIDQEKLADIYAPVEFNASALDKDAKTDEELSQARGIVYVMLFVLYLAVLMY